LSCLQPSLIDAVGAEPGLGNLQPKLQKAAQKARQWKEAAEAACSGGNAKAARKQLKKVVRKLIQFSHRLRSNSARKKTTPQCATRWPRAPTRSSGMRARSWATSAGGG
jgi:hypothetical protein